MRKLTCMEGGWIQPKSPSIAFDQTRRFYFYSAWFACRFRRVLVGGNRCARIVLQLNSWERSWSARAALSITHSTRPRALHLHASASLTTTDGHCLFPRLPFCVSCAFPLAHVRVGALARVSLSQDVHVGLRTKLHVLCRSLHQWSSGVLK